MKNELWRLTFHKACKPFNKKEGFSLELVEAVLCGTEVEEKSRACTYIAPDLVRQQAHRAHKKTPPEDFLSVTSILVQYQAPRLYKRDGYSLQLAGAVESDSLAVLQRWKRETGIAMVGKNMDEFMVTISERKEA